LVSFVADFSRFVVGLSAFWQETLYFGKFFRISENSNAKRKTPAQSKTESAGVFCLYNLA